MQIILIQQIHIVYNLMLGKSNVLLIVLIMDVLIGQILVLKCYLKLNVISVYKILLFVHGYQIHAVN